MKVFVDTKQAAKEVGLSVRHFRRFAEENGARMIQFGQARTPGQGKFFLMRGDVERLKALRGR